MPQVTQLIYSKNGIELRVIQQMLWHATIQTTCRYSHISVDQQSKAPSLIELLGDTIDPPPELQHSDESNPEFF